MSLRQAVATAVRGDEVPAPVLEAAFGEIMDGKASAVGIAALLVALQTKGETVGEIVAAARALRARARTAPLPDPRTLDTCGTGGDGARTFNISTAAAFVAAGAGGLSRVDSLELPVSVAARTWRTVAPETSRRFVS